jgi:hypothetical protein
MIVAISGNQYNNDSSLHGEPYKLSSGDTMSALSETCRVTSTYRYWFAFESTLQRLVLF